MPYLNVDLDFFDHRKTRRLVGLLGRGAEVLPLRLWAYCGKFHADDGRLTDYSPEELESMLCWWGKPGAMLPAMLKAEFVGRDGSGLFVHGWTEHQGHIAAFKAKGKAMAEARWAKAKADAASIAASNAARGVQAMPLPTDPTDSSLSGNAGDDPNLWPQKAAVSEPAPPNIMDRAKPLHAWYCEQIGAEVRLDMSLERAWFDWFRAQYTEDQFKRVFRYIKKQVDAKKRNDGALKLSNLLQPERFNEDLAVAMRNSKPTTPKPAAAIQEPEQPRTAEDWEEGAKKLRELKHSLRLNSVQE